MSSRASSSPTPEPAESAPTESPADSSSQAPSSYPSWLRGTAFETTLIAAGVVLLLVMLYGMYTPPQEEVFLTPPLVGLAGAVLLWPLRRHKAVRALLLSGGLLLLLWIMDKISRVLIPFAGVYLLAYLLNPIVERLKRHHKVPRWLSSLAMSAFVVGLFVLFFLILVPGIASQVETLSEHILDAVEGLRRWLETSLLLNTLEGAGFLEKQEAVAQIQSIVKEQAGRLPGAVEDMLSSLGSVLGIVTILALVPVILFYTLKDYPSIQDELIDLFPTADGRRDYLIEAGSIVGHYLRGQLIISTIAAFNVSILLMLFGVPFWLLIGLTGGVLNFIPQLGAIMTMIIGALVAFVFGGWIKAAIVIGVLLGQSFLEQSVLTPNILSYQVGLHPVLVLFSLLTFGTLLGIFGLLIAVPATAILVTAYRAYREELTLDLSEFSAQDENNG